MLCCGLLIGPASGNDLEFFEQRIRPLLVEHCIACHGPQEQESDLRLDHRSFLLEEGNYGYPVVPGKPDESIVYRAVAHADDDLQMPERGDKLPDELVADLRRWIEIGAPWPDEPIPSQSNTEAETFDLAARKEQLPWIWEAPDQQPLPKVATKSWPTDDVDFFVLAALEREGLQPAPPASPQHWLRRTHFVITGLPPTVEELDGFLADSSPSARARVVDELLASPHFGERWARHWMDLMRFAESRGHESDFIIANAYHYRDYLIQAFNSGISYDQFIAEHLAGDLLENPRLHPSSGANLSILGTGWAFLGEEIHSPVDIRQDECDRVDNKIDVLGKSFLGLTLACARCHDHKFDAIAQRDYYAMAGFMLSSSYRQTRFETSEHNRQIAEELRDLTQKTQDQFRRSWAAEFAKGTGSTAQYLLAAGGVLDADRPVESTAADLQLSVPRLQAWVDALRAAGEDEADPLYFAARIMQSDPVGQSATLDSLIAAGESRQRSADAVLAKCRVLADYREPGATLWFQDGPSFGRAPRPTGSVVIGLSEEDPIRFATYGAAVKDPFWDVLQLAAGNENDSGSLAAAQRAGRMLRTPKFELTNGRLYYLAAGEARIYAGVDSHLMLSGPLHGHLMKTVRGDRGWHAHDVHVSDGERAHVEFGALAGKPFEVSLIVEAEQTPEWVEPPNSLTAKLLRDLTKRSPADGAFVGTTQSKRFDSTATEISRRLAQRYSELFSSTAARLADGSLVGTAEASGRAEIANWMTRRAALFCTDKDSWISDMQNIRKAYRQQRSRLQQRVRTHSRTAVAWMDGNGVDERLLVRGKYQRPAEAVARGLPAAFPDRQPIKGPGSGRDELARQIASVDNPLTSRVIVNRVWHHLFGRGIVSTVDNFGYLGSRPSHPELLDHLSWQFMHQQQWSLKRLIRRLVLSRTFAMSSTAGDPQALRQDPQNLLLHRMPVRRLEGEALRDAVLAVSGRLDRQLHGRSVPVHLTEFTIGRGRPGQSGPLDGMGRRSVYIAVRRNFLSPLMLVFDMPVPFSTVGRRNVTNVPAQSLALMNDPFLFEQAEVWADRLRTQYPELSTEQRLERAYLQLFSRRPETEELNDCLRLRDELTELHQCSPDDKQVWTDLLHALYSVNDFVFVQ